MFSFFSSLVIFSYFFSRPNRTVPVVKMTISLVDKGLTSLSCFSFFIYLHCLLFLERKYFLFSCITLVYVSPLASVAELNFTCFLRSRCSMEMSCPDDIGRDSWDWVGPPAWGRACFNSPEWGGRSSPVKTEPLSDCIIVVVVGVVGKDACCC